MRIDAYNAISQVYGANRTSGPKETKKEESVGRKDQVSISSFGKDYQIAKQAVADASDVREDKVSAMKAKYSGDVSVDVDDFASVLLQKYNSAAV